MTLEILNTMETSTEGIILEACMNIMSKHVSSSKRTALKLGSVAQPAPTESEMRTLDFIHEYVDHAVSAEGLSKGWSSFSRPFILIFRAFNPRSTITYSWNAGLIHEPTFSSSVLEEA